MQFQLLRQSRRHFQNYTLIKLCLALPINPTARKYSILSNIFAISLGQKFSISSHKTTSASNGNSLCFLLYFPAIAGSDRAVCAQFICIASAHPGRVPFVYSKPSQKTDKDHAFFLAYPFFSQQTVRSPIWITYRLGKILRTAFGKHRTLPRTKKVSTGLVTPFTILYSANKKATPLGWLSYWPFLITLDAAA